MKVILIAAISVDGKIAERPDQTSLDWTSKEDTKFFVEKTKEAGVVVMGARTFATIGKPLKGRRLIVLSNRRDPQSGNRRGPRTPPEGTVEFANMSPSQLVKMLEEQSHDAVVVAGGASVYSQFLREGLVTDLYLTVEPFLFGDGVPLVSGVQRIRLRLVEARPLGETAVLLHYLIP